MATHAQFAVADTQPSKAVVGGRWKGCVSVIVPVYNEIAHVDELLQAIHNSPVRKEIIIVDDGSTDGTREKLRAMPPANDVSVVFHEKNCGKGANNSRSPPASGRPVSVSIPAASCKRLA